MVWLNEAQFYLLTEGSDQGERVAARLRALLSDRAIEPVIPSIRRRKPLIPYDVRTYRERNLIERMFCRLKDFRRVATRYDKLARNFLAGVMLAAALIWWI